MKAIRTLCLIVCAATTARAQTIYTPLSNLNQPSGGTSAYVNSTIARGDSFTTGNTPAYLSNISLLVAGYYNGGSPAPLTVALYDDAAGSPGNLSAILSGNSYPTNDARAVYSYASTNSPAVVLSANTTYWVVASSSDTTQGYYILPLPTTNTLDPGSIWTIGMLKDYENGNWSLSGNYLSFSVSVTNPIPPAMAISMGAATQTNVTTVSNLGQPAGSAAGVSSSASIAVSFTTGSAASSLSSVSVAMSASPAPPLGSSYQPLNVSLDSDANGSPGGTLAILSGDSDPTNAGVYTYTNMSVVPLLANMTYWVVESTAGAVPYSWNLATSAAVDLGSAWTLGVMKGNYGGGWALDSGYYPQFSIAATTNVPPSFLLTYLTPDFSFVLQQNADLATTNWGDVTNAIQLTGVNTNQTVFYVPSTAEQMFYRLHPP